MKRSSRTSIPNKVGAEVQANFVAVFSQLGGREAFADWAKENRSEFYRHYARLLPTEVVAPIDTRDPSELTTEELMQAIRELELQTEADKGNGGEVHDHEEAQSKVLAERENLQ